LSRCAWAAAAVVAALALSGAGCDTAHLRKERLRFDIDPEVRFAERNVILLIVDGLRADTFERELRAGRLPNIQRYLVERGLRGRCLSSLLTCTYPDIAALLTGCFPGHHGVPSMTFFDRERLLSRRYDSPGRMGRVRADLRRPTVFQRLAPEPSVCILTQISSGATYFVENFQTAGLAYFFGQWRRLDYLSMVRFRLVAQLARRWGRYPRLVVTYLPSLDFAAYRYGVDSPEYLALLRHIDFLVGLLMRALREEGVLERFTFVLTSDHGHIRTRPDGYFDIRGYVDRELGVPATAASASERRSWRERWRRFGPYAAVVLDAGNRAAMLYLRSFRTPPSESAPHPWAARPSLDELRRYPSGSGRAVDLLRGLARHPAVDLVLARPGPSELVVFSQEGEALIRREPSCGAASQAASKAAPDAASGADSRAGGPGPEPRYAYSVLAGEDPIGYTEEPALRGLVGTGPHPARLWYRRSLGTRYPDFIPQVWALFDSPLVGDIVVFARRGWGFHPTHASDHGGPLAGEMWVPLVVAGPEVRRGELEPVRQVDVMPTVLEYLGVEVPAGEVDGRSFLGSVLAPRRVVELVR